MNVWPGRPSVGVLTVAVTATAVAYGLIQAGPPRIERQRRLDERRTADLRSIAEAVDLYWTRRGSLPVALDLLSDMPLAGISLQDPASGQPYGYRVLTSTTFELCGVFATEWSPPTANMFWSHGAGRECFELDVHEVQRKKAEEDGTPNTRRLISGSAPWALITCRGPLRRLGR